MNTKHEVRKEIVWTVIGAIVMIVGVFSLRSHIDGLATPGSALNVALAIFLWGLSIAGAVVMIVNFDQWMRQD